ncbi:hypothetical protein ACFYVL_40975 [Streptomyces sp. NPDC004111]|uniref:hypothetical protein n=1 Tax=Streptomyces sp. NPDC004111 TaxID=3364690 RepID=UPI003675BA9E
MSYDLAVWEGPRPSDDTMAGDVFNALHAACSGQSIPPTDLIRRFVGDLLERWPDLGQGDEEDDEAIPWSTGPLLSEASGPLIYFGMVFSKYEQGADFAVERARALGLVCFDPQDWRLLT